MREKREKRGEMRAIEGKDKKSGDEREKILCSSDDDNTYAMRRIQFIGVT